MPSKLSLSDYVPNSTYTISS